MSGAAPTAAAPALPPILYINLARDEARRAHMEAEFARLRLPAQRLDAVLWTALPPGEQDALYSEALNAVQFHLPLVNGEKGCYASHIAAWRWLLDSPHEAVIVLEDDISLRDDFGPVCQALLQSGPDWDMVKLIGREELGKAEKLLGRTPLGAQHQLLHYRRVPSLTAAYLLRRAGARKLLATRLPFGRPIDVDLRHWWESQHLQIRGVQPALVRLAEASHDSSIGNKLAGSTARTRWRKFLHKVRYTLLNAWHVHRA